MTATLLVSLSAPQPPAIVAFSGTPLEIATMSLPPLASMRMRVVSVVCPLMATYIS